MGKAQVTRRVVVDTNVAVSALVFSKGRLSWLRLAWIEGTVVPVVSDKAIKELLAVLAYPKFDLSANDIGELMADYLPFAEVWTSAVPRSGVEVPDEDDEVFVDLAIAAEVDFLVTGDRHLIGLGPNVPIRVVTPGELREILGH
ncbi:MAG: putative toxin-antitoxin system toxin component, PIN family [Trueperaceae bacterium]